MAHEPEKPQAGDMAFLGPMDNLAEAIPTLPIPEPMEAQEGRIDFAGMRPWHMCRGAI